MRTVQEIFQGEDPIKFFLDCKVDFGKWVTRVMGLEYTWFHQEWFELLENYRYVAVQAFRHSGKSEIMIVAYTAWYCFYNRDKQIIIVSKNLPMSTELLYRIKNAIASNELLKDIIPKKSFDITWNKTEIDLINGCRILCKPYGDPCRSYHVDRVVCDEGGEYENKVEFYSAMMPIINMKRGNMLVIGTPKSAIDLLSELFDHKLNPVWKCKKYPIYRIDKGKFVPAWPERFPMPEIDHIRLSEGLDCFNREYLLNPMAIGSSPFPPEIVFKSFDGNMVLQNSGDEGRDYYVGVDLALSAAAKADFSVYSVIEKMDNGKLRLVHMERYKGLGEPVQWDRIEEIYNRFKPKRVLVDESYIGKTTINELRNRGVPAQGFKFQDKRNELIEMLSSLFYKEQIVIPANNTDSLTKSLTDVLISELTHMTSEESKTGTGRIVYKSGAHDDAVISLSLAVRSATDQRSSVSGSVVTDIQMSHHQQFNERDLLDLNKF